MLTEKINIDELCSKAEALCRQIAPRDLDGVPLYIVPLSKVPAGLSGISQFDGYTSISLDLYMKGVIGPAWKGRGPCMCIHDILPTGEMNAIDVETAFNGIVVHELGHILGRSMLFEERDDSDQAAIAAEATKFGADVNGPFPPMQRLVPFYGHGAIYIRAILHLCYRAAKVGMGVSPSEVYLANGYSLSRTIQYRTALGAEPRRMVDASFEEICNTPYPKAFWRLWTSDVAHWLPRCPPFFER
jgi:hypothetical protein